MVPVVPGSILQSPICQWLGGGGRQFFNDNDQKSDDSIRGKESKK